MMICSLYETVLRVKVYAMKKWTVLLACIASSVGAHPTQMHHWEIASRDPDRIYLSFNGDPATSCGVTWRTSMEVEKAVAEIAPARPAPAFYTAAKRINAKTQLIDPRIASPNAQGPVAYHQVDFTSLKPDTLYAYRVGDGKEHWSEWIQFRTAKADRSPFCFLYFGDAQNDILSRWSRAIRMAHQTAPRAAFMIHAGDLVDRAHRDSEWAEWFKAGSFLHAQTPGMPVLGNHEYATGSPAAASEKIKSILWRPQFNLPVEQRLPHQLHETCYRIDYQGARFIVLNSNDALEEQTDWLEDQLKAPGAHWRIVIFHHPLFPPNGRPHYPEELRQDWIDLLKKYKVDLLLQGHDHAYLNGVLNTPQQDIEHQMLIITSVSGPKQYPMNPDAIKTFAKDGFSPLYRGENSQFFGHIAVNEQTITVDTYLVDGSLYDRTTIFKGKNRAGNRIKKEQIKAPIRTFSNTHEYSGKRL